MLYIKNLFWLLFNSGYGNVFPSTAVGKLLTILYGMIAIPLCSLLISRISDVIIRLTKAIYYMTLDPSGVPVGLREAYHRIDATFDFRVSLEIMITKSFNMLNFWLLILFFFSSYNKYSVKDLSFRLTEA